MEPRALCRDDDAISSVLGVVLMVAVTIILAAVIGTFVLGIGSELTDSSPSASWEFSENVNGNATTANSSVTILHGGGEEVDASTLEVTIGSETVYPDGEAGSGFTVNANNWEDPVTASDRLVVTENTSELQGKMVRLYWSNGDSSTILADQQLG